jgi:hypothetical protein
LWRLALPGFCASFVSIGLARYTPLLPALVGHGWFAVGTAAYLGHHPAAQAGAWRKATASFAIFQAAGAYGMSLIYNWSGADYRLLFGLGAAALAVAAVLAILAGSRRDSEVQGRGA